jgi:tetratricopeptide (TPR) repeat protein
MLTPSPMLAKKNRNLCGALVLLTLTFFIAGCTPAGPRALLKGKKLLDRGDYVAAVQELKTATDLLPTNAQAWNYYGVACQQAGQPDTAVTAYQRALTLDRDLIEAHYNLGSLWLEQNKPAEAKTEFTVYTLRRNNEPDGWLKLGAAQLSLGELTPAEKSFGTAYYFNTNNAEALNGLGLVRVRRGQPREASQFFAAAVQYHPDYAPALLNLATVAEENLHDNKFALQNYRAYLALTPRPDNWDAVNVLANNLEKNLEQPAMAASAPPPITAASAAPAPAPVVSEPRTQPVVRPIASESRPVVARATPAPPPRLAATTSVAVARPRPELKAEPKPEPVVVPLAERIVVAPEPVVAKTQPQVVRTRPAPPMNYSQTGVTPLPASADGGQATMVPLLPPKFNLPPPAPTTEARPVKLIPAAAPVYPRYSYRSPRNPPAGDRVAAQAQFSKARVYEQSSRWTEAMEWYRRATESDPSWFEAQYNYGVLAYRLRSYAAALGAYENALAIQPGSLDARYNFALTLRSAGYVTDAVDELEKIATANPDDARVQLALGNLYAQKLNNPAQARRHYLKLLELDPHNSQANYVRYWLAANPG